MFPLRSPLSTLLPAAFALLSAPAWAQTSIDPATSPVFGDGDTRLGIGYDSRYKLRGEILQRVAGDERSAWLGEGWIGRQAGGVKIDRHWYPDDNGPVWKLFAAWDRNKWNDQKLSVGGGAENESWFWGAYGSKGLTGDRERDVFTTVVNDTRPGTDPDLGDYLQEFTTTTTVRSFERAYDYGVGARIGKVFGSALVRVVGGLDYEWHQSSVALTTASVGVEKFFLNSPHSILLTAAVSDRRGESEGSNNQQRVGIYWRYQFGGVPKAAASTQVRPAASAAVEPAVQPATQAVAAPTSTTERRIVPVTESIATETFFDLDRAALKTDAFQILDRLAGRLKTASLEGTLKVIGHTCDLGPTAYNQRLSERRAAAVREYLITTGAVSADRVVAVGMGEEDPRYPNKRGERQKNRRCDIEFTVIEQKTETVAVAAPPKVAVPPAAEPPVAVEPPQAYPWWQRALRNPVAHKREVDTYTRRETSTTVVAGERQYLNQPPVAVDDQLSWFGSQMPAILHVLPNDSDPDGDTLHIVSVTNGSNGDVTILPDGTLRYMWRTPREGVDHFTYTVSDGKGKTSTATVTLTVIDP